MNDDTLEYFDFGPNEWRLVDMLVSKPEQRITSDGVYTRVWTDERITAMQLPEPTVVRDMQFKIQHVGTDRTVDSMRYTFLLSFADDWLDGFIYGLSDRDRTDIGRKLLDFCARYTFPDKSRQSRRIVRRRNRAKRKANK